MKLLPSIHSVKLGRLDRVVASVAVVVFVVSAILALPLSVAVLIEHRDRSGVLGVVSPTYSAYFVSPDGQLEPSKDSCVINKGQNFDRRQQFHRIVDGLACLGAGDSLVIDGQDAVGIVRPYDESGFGSKYKPIPSGSASNYTQIIGRCNQDIALRNTAFSRSTCKPVIQPSAATWGRSYETSQSYIWQVSGLSYVHWNNIELSASNLNLSPDGVWDNALCNCWANGGFLFEKGSNHNIVEAIKAHDLPGRAVQTAITPGFSRSTSLLLQNSEIYHNGWNYPASEVLRYGDGSVNDDGTTKWAINGKPTYWSQLEGIYIGTSDNELRGNYIYDNAGAGLQISAGNSLTADPLDVANNRIDQNYIASNGWKAKKEAVGGRDSAGLRLSAGSGMTFYNNILYNLPGIVIGNQQHANIYNNSFVYGERGAGVTNMFRWAHSDKSNQFYNNLLCYNRDNGALSDYMTFYGGTSAKALLISENGQLGTGSDTMLSLNSNNRYGSCSKNTVFIGNLDRGQPVTNQAAFLPGTEKFHIQNSSTVINGAQDGTGPYADFFGTIRAGTADIGASEYNPLPTPAPIVKIATLTKQNSHSTAKVPALATSCIRYESEEANLDPIIMLDTSTTPYSGGGYVGPYNIPGAAVEYKGLVIPTSGSYVLNLRYLAGYGDSEQSILVDGVKVDKHIFPGADTWQDWQTTSHILSLSKGSHSIRYEATGGKSLALDYADLCAAQSPAASPPTMTKVTDKISRIRGLILQNIVTATLLGASIFASYRILHSTQHKQALRGLSKRGVRR